MNINIMRFYCSPRSIDILINFIRDNHNNIMFSLDLDKMKLFFFKLSKSVDNEDKEIMKTLRMTVL